MTPISGLKRAATALQTYAAHDRPVVAAGNKVALVLAGNTPFYPLYVIAVAGADGLPWLLMTLAVFPFFAAVPAIARRQPVLGRVMLSLAGTANTLFCTWLLGPRSGIELFLLPCIALGSLLFGPGERVLMLLTAGLPLVCGYLMHGHYGEPPHLYPDAAYAALTSMNAISVGTLTMFLGIVFSALYAAPADATGAAPQPRR